MTDETVTKHVRPRRIEIMTRDNGMLEAGILLSDGQALAPYIGSRRGSISLVDAVWVASGTKLQQLTLRQTEIVWARPLEADIPLVNVIPLEKENLSVEVALAGGVIARGRFPMVPGQSISEHLSALGLFPVLYGAHLRGRSEPLGDIAVSQQAIQSVRDVSGRTAQAEWVRGGVAGGAKAHWLLRSARELNLRGADALSLSPSTPIAEAWRQVCTAAGITEDDLAQAVSQQLRLDLADAEALAVPGDHGVPESLIERYGIRPIASDARTLTVATADPMNGDAEQALAFACKRRVTFVLATPRALHLQVPESEEPELDELLKNTTMDADAVRIDDDQEPDEVEIDEISAEPVIRLANVILREAVRANASDIHLEPDQSRGIVRFRVDGMLRPFMHVPLNALHRVISRYKIVARLDIADRVRPQDGRVRIRVEGRSYELRLSTVPTQDAEKAVIRIAGSVQEQTLDELDIPAYELQRLRQLLSFRDGIIVVTGPTGSGKTTTLYGALNELNTGKVNITTVEDPIERALPGITQIQVQTRRGVTFASALRAILRQDPDVILLGEIRDLETAEIAVQAASTGHLVLTTLHTTSAVGVVARLRDLGLESSSLAGSLRGIVAQRLARRVCPGCHGAGCLTCAGTGYRGRIPLMEVLTSTPLFGELVGRGALFHDLQLAAEQEGMRPMRDVAAEAVHAGRTTQEEIARVLGDAENEARMQAAFASGDGRIRGAARPALAAENAEAFEAEPVMLNAGPAQETTGLPARLSDVAPEEDPATRRRSEVLRSLLQGLDRCVADGQTTGEVLGFAAEQIASAIESPLVWIATLDGNALEIRARAGACAPYVRELMPDWEDLETSESAVAVALRTRAPQGRMLEDEPGFDEWREHARAHGLPVFIVMPLVCDGVSIGVMGLHARNMAGLDRQAGNELLHVSDRIAGAVQRLRQLEAVGVQLSALELAADSVIMTDRSGTIQWVNRSFTQLSGYAAAEAIGQPVSILRSGRHDADFYRDMWETITAGKAWRGELYNLRKDGTSYAVEQTITPVITGERVVTHFLSVQRDITERKQREENVRQLVTSDPLTGLPNSRALETELGKCVASAAAGSAESALLLIHMDGAATLKDAADQDAAENLVREVAAILTDTLRPGDYLARIGDNEFAALLPETPQQGALVAADRLRAAANRRLQAGAAAGTGMAISVGIAVIDGTQSARGVLAMADTALYSNRDRRDSVVVSQADDPLSQGSAEWAQRIRKALEDDQFFLHFQPVIRLSTRALSHFDALLRLHDDEGDVVPARVFITHAENLGLMPQIDRWVVENVMRLLQTSPDLSVSLNLAPSTVANAGFRQFMQRQSRRMAAVGPRIIFEVNEVAAPEELAKVAEHMNRLREVGCRFALDNFGIGNASLASLGVLPVDFVKLDGALIRGIDIDQDRHDIVRALASVARALGKEVIAGWAERGSIVELLPDLGIELAQGHYLGLPSPELRRAVVPPTENGLSKHRPEIVPDPASAPFNESWRVPVAV